MRFAFLQEEGDKIIRGRRGGVRLGKKVREGSTKDGMNGIKIPFLRLCKSKF